MGRHIGPPMITTSVRISPEFHKLCVDLHISFSEAIRKGIALELAERGQCGYDNDLNIVRRLETAMAKIQELCEEKEGNGVRSDTSRPEAALTLT